MLSINFTPPEQVLIGLGERAKEARLRLNLSRKTLADRSGVPESTIKRFETTGLIGTASLVDILIALDRVEELDRLLSASAIPSIRELESKKRRRGRQWLSAWIEISLSAATW